MNYIGIDVASKKLNIHISEKDGGDYEIPNIREALQSFVGQHSISPDKFIIGAESTGKYHLITQKFFVEQGFEFRLLNPICTKQTTKATVRKKKTDQSDAVLIAFMLSQGAGDKITPEQLNTAKRNLLRTRNTLNKHMKAIGLLRDQLKMDTNRNEMKKAIKALETVIKTMKVTAKELEKEVLGQKQNQDEKIIQSIPGFAKLLSAAVSSEVGSFKRFPSARQFKAYVGIDPKVIQSGNSQRYGRITKRGKPHLRSAFYLAAQVARRYDPELKAFFEKKRSEGKPFRVAVCAVARKLCERVYAVVTKGVPYEIRQLTFS